MYISTTLTTKHTFQATNPRQSNPQSSLSNYFKHSDTVHSFNVKPIKMLSDPVAEAFGLIHRHPSGENFFRVCVSYLAIRFISNHTSRLLVWLKKSNFWPLYDGGPAKEDSSSFGGVKMVSRVLVIQARFVYSALYISVTLFLWLRISLSMVLRCLFNRTRYQW